MTRATQHFGVFLLALSLAAFGACGKKGPPILPEDIPYGTVEIKRVSVREGNVRLVFRIPRTRNYMEAENPWILARIMRSTGDKARFREVGAIKEAEGFAFGGEVAYFDAGAAVGEPLQYRMELRKDRATIRAISEAVDIVPAEVPALEGSPAAKGRGNAVTLDWRAPRSAVGEIMFQVYRRVVGGEREVLINPEPVRGTAYTDTAVSPAEKYCYRVRGMIRSGKVDFEGPAGGETCLGGEDMIPPVPPDGLMVSVLGDALSLSWTAVDSADLFGYNVYRAAPGEPFTRITANPVRGVSFLDEKIEAGLYYRYRVTAVDNSPRRNESSFSGIVEAGLK